MFSTKERVVELAEERGMNLYQFCKYYGFSYQTLASSNKRNGELKVDTIEKICFVIGISFADFFNREPEGDCYERGNKSIRGG